MAGSVRSTLTSLARLMGRSSGNDERLIALVRDLGLTYLSEQKLRSLMAACRAAKARNTGARYIEAGCALGGSTVIVANLLAPAAELFVYDTFEGMPPPTDRDTPDVHERYQIIATGKSKGINGHQYYGYRTDLLESVALRQNVPPRILGRVHLVKGLVQQTLPVGHPVALAHVDVDWYDPVSLCAHRIFPALEVGGCIIFDDYLDYRSCRDAVDEYFAPHREAVHMDLSAGSCSVTKLCQVPPTKAAGFA